MAPVVLRSTLPIDEIPQARLTPVFVVEGREVFLNPFDLTNIETARRGLPVTSRAGDDDATWRVQKALDDAFAHYQTGLGTCLTAASW